MKLDLPLLDYIQAVLRVCKITGIESVVIEQDSVRGLQQPDRSIALIHTENIPNLPFGGLGLTRLNELQARIDIARSQRDFSVEAQIKPDTNHVFSLLLKAKGIKIDYRCADPSKIDARKSIKDPLHHKVTINPDVVSMLSKGIGATGAERVSLISNSEGVSLELVDVNNDVFKYVFAESSENVVQESLGKFAHRYPAKLIHTVFKENPNGEFYVGSQGLLRMAINSFNVFVLPVA